MMKRRIVVKLGGSSLQNPETLRELSAVVRGYRNRGYQVVLVHGGGPAINAELTKRGIEWKFINGQRQTTPEMIDVIDEVLAKRINGALVSSLHESDIGAIGLSGAADRILFCTQANEELMCVGQVENVDVSAIEEALALEGSPVPVIAPVGFDTREVKYNVNADWAATKIAIALGAKKLVFLTDQIGILDGNKKLVRTARPYKIHKMIEEGVISGGMCTKVLAMMTALEAGVDQVRVLHASFASQIFAQGPKIGTILSDPYNHTEKDVMHGHAS